MEGQVIYKEEKTNFSINKKNILIESLTPLYSGSEEKILKKDVEQSLFEVFKKYMKS